MLEVARREIWPLHCCAERVQDKRLLYFNSCYELINISEYVNDAKYFNICFSTDSGFGEIAYIENLSVLFDTSNLEFRFWFRASLTFINSCPTRCNTKQSIYCSASSLYMFRVSTTPIIRSTQNCNYSLRYCAATSLQRCQLVHVGGR